MPITPLPDGLIFFQGQLWTLCTLRKPHQCKPTHLPITGRAFRPFCNGKHRADRISVLAMNEALRRLSKQG